MIGTPSRARRTAGAINCASVNLPEPYRLSASAQPGDGAGHADPEPGIAGFFRIGLAVGPEEYVGCRRGGRRFAIVEGDSSLRRGEMDHHETAAADVPGLGQRHRKREPDRDRGIDGIAAALQDVEADLGRLLFLVATMPCWPVATCAAAVPAPSSRRSWAISAGATGAERELIATASYKEDVTRGQRRSCPGCARSPTVTPNRSA